MFQNYKFYSLIGIISILFFFSKCQEKNNVKTFVNPCHCNDLIYDELYNHMFQEKYMYQHWWEVGDIVLMDQLLTLHKRDQNDPEILAKRVLHRITFRISNIDRDGYYVEKYNG